MQLGGAVPFVLRARDLFHQQQIARGALVLGRDHQQLRPQVQLAAGTIELVGGANIARGQVENWGPLAPEYVLAEKPEVILLAGSEWLSSPEAVRVGFNADAAEVQARMLSYLTRPGWAGLPAVTSGEVHAIYHGGARSLSDFVFARYLGKVLHPEAFADVDPQAELAAYYAEWLPIPLDGIFVQKLQ